MKTTLSILTNSKSKPVTRVSFNENRELANDVSTIGFTSTYKNEGEKEIALKLVEAFMIKYPAFSEQNGNEYDSGTGWISANRPKETSEESSDEDLASVIDFLGA